jgi:TonB family protein
MAVETIALQQKFAIGQEDSRRLMRIMYVVLAIEVALGILLYVIEPSQETSDFFERVAPERVAKLVVVKKEVQTEVSKEGGKVGGEKKKKKESGEESTAKKASSGGGGDPRAKVTAKGVLGIIGGKISGSVGVTDMASSILGSGGMVDDIDQVISSVGGLKVGGTGGTGRKGKAGIGYGDGYSSGFGGGGGGSLDDLIGGLGGADAMSAIDLKKKGNVKITTGLSQIAEGSTGDRDMDEIRAVVMERLGGVKYAYNTMLKTYPNLQGKITVKFTIAASGEVIKVVMVESNMNCPELEEKITRIISKWQFRKIDSGDVTVIYPFIFAPGQ